MSIRVLTWHIPEITGDGTNQGPVYFLEKDYEALKLRVRAGIAPDSEPLLVDIMDDGVSILKRLTTRTQSIDRSDGQIHFYGASGNFTVGETVTGGTSSVTAKVIEQKHGYLVIRNASGNFTLAETITGSSSASTATVAAWVKERQLTTTVAEVQNPVGQLDVGDTTNPEAADFDETKVTLEAGSWVSLDIPKSGGAKEITVHLEVETISEDDEIES